jgi:hypothetical protein
VMFVGRNESVAELGKGSEQFPPRLVGLRSSACERVGDRGAVADIERIQS